MLVFGIGAVGNVMPCLTAVETGPNIVVGGGDLACIALRGLHGVLAPELCVRGLVKASRPLIRVLVINDNGLWINDFI